MKFLFADHSDIFDPWGSVGFRASAPRVFAPAPPIPFNVSHTAPPAGRVVRRHRAQGRHPASPGRSTAHRRATGSTWRTSASSTTSPATTGATTPAASTARSSAATSTPRTPRVMKVSPCTSSPARTGTTGPRTSTTPVFNEGDAWGGIWSSAAQRFILTPKGIQRYEHKAVNELFLNARRVADRAHQPGRLHVDAADRQRLQGGQGGRARHAHPARAAAVRRVPARAERVGTRPTWSSTTAPRSSTKGATSWV